MYGIATALSAASIVRRSGNKRMTEMKLLAIAVLAVVLVGCASGGRPSSYLNKDGNAASWGESKREAHPSLADNSRKW